MRNIIVMKFINIYMLLMKSSAYSPTPQPSSIDNPPFIWISSRFLQKKSWRPPPPRPPLSMIFGGNKTSEQISNFWKTNMKTNENKRFPKLLPLLLIPCLTNLNQHNRFSFFISWMPTSWKIWKWSTNSF